MIEYLKSLLEHTLEYIKKFTAESAINLLISAIGALHVSRI